MPSVLLQPAAHLVMSTVKPSGPVMVLPSAESPHLLSVIRLTTAARSVSQSFSHSSIVFGSGLATVVAVPGTVVELRASCTPLSTVTPVAPSPLSLPLLPHAAASSERPTTAPVHRRSEALRRCMLSPCRYGTVSPESVAANGSRSDPRLSQHPHGDLRTFPADEGCFGPFRARFGPRCGETRKDPRLRPAGPSVAPAEEPGRPSVDGYSQAALAKIQRQFLVLPSSRNRSLTFS